MNTIPDIQTCDASAQARVCRMGRWFRIRSEAERELERLLNIGWSGSLHDHEDIWRVEVVRPLADAPFAT